MPCRKAGHFICMKKLKINQMMSIASTKKVHTNGRIMVRYSQGCTTVAYRNSAVNKKNNNQYKPLYFLDVVVMF